MAPSILLAESAPTPPATPSQSGGTTTPTTTSLTEKAISSLPTLAELDPSKTTITRNASPKPVPTGWTDPLLAAGSTYCTDHMLTIRWNSATGWEAPQIVPYGPLSLMPTASVLHYATECFEGMKLYRGDDSKLRLFRPMLNSQRFLMSSIRISCPTFDPVAFCDILRQFCAVEGRKWLPRARDTLYLRPTMIATHPQLGVRKPDEALLFVVLSYLPVLNSKPLAILGSKDDACRAWPGGFGFAKVGANYGPTLMATAEARNEGYDQILWLFGKEGWVTEAGASNLFVLWRTKEHGKLELVTAPLEEKIILDGVTRRSILGLARARLEKKGSKWAEKLGLEEVQVSERRYTATDIVEASEEGRLVESFTVGTAYFVAAIERMNLRGKDVAVPVGKPGVHGGLAKYGAALKVWLEDIMYGAVESSLLEKETGTWGVVVDENAA